MSIYEKTDTRQVIFSGDVGIGFSNPRTKLVINGGMVIGSNMLGERIPHNTLVVEGKIGIGVSNPEYALDIDGAISSSGFCNLLYNDPLSNSEYHAPTSYIYNQTFLKLEETSNAIYSNLDSIEYSSNTSTYSSNGLIFLSNDLFPRYLSTSNTLFNTSNNIYSRYFNTSNFVYLFSNDVYEIFLNTSNNAYDMSNDIYGQYYTTSNNVYEFSNHVYTTINAFSVDIYDRYNSTSNTVRDTSNDLYPRYFQTSNSLRETSNILRNNSNDLFPRYFQTSNSLRETSNIVRDNSNDLYPRYFQTSNSLAETSNDLFPRYFQTSNSLRETSNIVRDNSNDLYPRYLQTSNSLTETSNDLFPRYFQTSNSLRETSNIVRNNSNDLYPRYFQTSNSLTETSNIVRNNSNDLFPRYFQTSNSLRETSNDIYPRYFQTSNSLRETSNIVKDNSNDLYPRYFNTSNFTYIFSNDVYSNLNNSGNNITGFSNNIYLVTSNNSNILHPRSTFGSNTSVYSSNFGIANSNVLHPQASFASNLVVTTSNTLYPQATFGSNTGVYSSNFGIANSNVLHPRSTFGSNTSVYSSNFGIANSNVLHPRTTFGSNTAVWSSNNLININGDSNITGTYYITNTHPLGLSSSFIFSANVSQNTSAEYIGEAFIKTDTSNVDRIILSVVHNSNQVVRIRNNGSIIATTITSSNIDTLSNNLFNRNTGGIISSNVEIIGSMTLRNGNIQNTFSNNQLLFGFSNTNTFRHAIKTRHLLNNDNTNNAVDIFVWQSNQNSNDIGNKHIMSITSIGTGIGSSNPTERLEVNGKIYSTTQILGTSNDSVNTPSFSFKEDSNTGIYHPSGTGVLAFTTTGVERIRITNNGNVGIGTNNPNASLQFSNDLRSRKIVLFENSNNDHQFSGFGINSDTFRYQVGNTLSDHVFYAGTNSNSSAELTRITGTGMLGLGIDPQAQIHINNSIVNTSNYGILLGGSRYSTLPSSVNGILMTVGNNIANNRQLWIMDSSNTNKNTSNIALRLIVRGTQTPVIDAVTTDDTTNRQLQIGNNQGVFIPGNLGIGTSNPTNNLEVVGSINATTLQQGGTGVSLVGHNHDASNITTGTLPVVRGGTGTTTSTGTGNVVLSASPTITGTLFVNNKLDIIHSQTSNWWENGICFAPQDGVTTSNALGLIQFPDDGIERNSSNPRGGWSIGRGNVYSDRRITVRIPDYSAYTSTGVIPRFDIITTGSSNILSCTANGNVGIGTTTPNAPLQFPNNAINRKIVLFEIGNNDHEFYGFGVNGNTLRYQVPALADRHVFFAANSSSTSTEIMRIQGNGNVGIGASNPIQMLHVRGQTSNDAILFVEPGEWNSVGDYGEIHLGDSNHFIRGEFSNGMLFNDINQIIFATSNGNNVRMTINNNGNILMNSNLTACNISGLTINGTTLQQGGTAVSLVGHNHDASNITTGTLPVARGGTGTTTSTGTGNVVLSASPTFTGTVSAATINATTLQQGGTAVSLVGHNHDASNITTGTLPVARGGTGTTTSTGTGNVVLSASPTITGTATINAIDCTNFYDPLPIIYFGSAGGGGTTRLTIQNTGIADGSPQRLTLGVEGSAFSGTAVINTTKANVAADVPLSIRTDGNERLRINNNGLVQVNSNLTACNITTTLLTSTTQVLGTSNDTVTLPSFSFSQDTNTGMYHPSVNDTLGFVTAGTERVRISSNGFVGIGMSNPNGSLHFDNGLQNRKIILWETSNNDHQYGGFGYNAFTFRYQVPDTINSHIFYAGTSTSSSTELFRIQGNGNVGIGTTTTNAPLQFANSLVNRKVVLWETSNNDHQYYGFGVNSGALRYQLDLTSSAHIFYTGTSSTTSRELMRIQGDGLVGIGQFAPVSLQGSSLHVQTSNVFAIQAEFENKGTGRAGIALTSTGGSTFITHQTDNALAIYGSSLQSYLSDTNFIYMDNSQNQRAIIRTTNGNPAWNVANATLYVARDNTTSRSINAAGTVNASGADYAEYMLKSSSNIDFNKGDIVGFNNKGKLTDKYSESISFGVKSTNPSIVGGDTWFTNSNICPADSNSQEYQEWMNKYSEQRKMIDRIGFCGKVPINLYGANPGDYIVPYASLNDTILASNISEEIITFTQYKKSVGRVLSILDDGRAEIIIKTV